MGFQINDPAVRSRLDSRAKPYYLRLSDELSIGYRKGKTVSRWVIRRKIDGRHRISTLARVLPDDNGPADGKLVLNFQQLVEKIMTREKLACSFCGKPSTQVAKLIAGPGVFICDACVALCQLVLDNPEVDGKLLLEDGKPVMRAGKPVFTPFSEAEMAAKKALLGTD